MIKFLNQTPVLWTNNLTETIEFYTTVLEFKLIEKLDEIGWALLRKDEVELMISLPNSHYNFKEPNFTGSFYLRVSDVDKLWEKLKDKCSIVYPLEDFDRGMKEFAIYDNNRYILQFGQEI